MAVCDSKLKCLICATPNSTFLDNWCSKKLIGNHLKVVFILRNVLNIERDKLVKFLQGCPNINGWISVCDTCESLVNQCKELYQEVLEAKRKFENGKERIIKIVKESWSSNCNDNDTKGTLDIFKEVREDVNNRKECIKAVNFTFGDLTADQLAAKLISQPQPNDKIVIKEEFEDGIHSNFEFDTWTGNDQDDYDEEIPDVKGPLKIEQESSDSDDDDNYKLKKKRRKQTRKCPPFKCPFCKTYSAPFTSSVYPTLQMKHYQNCKSSTKLSIKEIPCFNCTQFKCSSNNLVQFYNHVLSCLNYNSGKSYQEMPLAFRVFQCNLCPTTEKSQEFFTFSKFIGHLINHKQLIYKCTHCSKPLKNSVDSDKHWRKHHPCEYLDIPEGQRLSSLCHVLTPPALPTVPWWCPQCGQEFSSEDLRDLHVSSNHPPMSKDNPCPQCDKRYFCLKELELHQTIFHPPETIINFSTCRKFHRCPHCPEVFTGSAGKTDLLEHRSRVHNDCQFKCPTCQKEYISESGLRTHRKIHELNLKCDQCGKNYLTERSFRNHVAVVHEKSNAFTCDLCGKNLGEKRSLQNHQRDIHGLSEKKWKCEVEGCGRRFREVRTFKAHTARHAKCPEFKCSFCGKEFYMKFNLNRHENTVHSQTTEEDFVCDECPFRTKFKCNLVTHKKGGHNPETLFRAVRKARKADRKKKANKNAKKKCLKKI